MNFLLGFLIAAAVGLTGIGGGSFTVPALVLLAGLTAGEAVGTAFLFAGVLRVDRCPVLSAGEANSFALPLASAPRSSSGSLSGHLGASLIESRRGESVHNRDTRHSPGGVIQRDLYRANAKSGVCREKPPLASLDRIAHWS